MIGDPGSITAAAPPGECDRRERRRRAMLDAARALFLERGFDAVSLADIVRRSGGSLATLYALFGGKSGILAAVLSDKQFARLDALDSIVDTPRPPADMLRAIAHLLHDHFIDPETIALMRLAMGESLRDPSFAQLVFRTSHLPALGRVEVLFERWRTDGIGRIGDPQLAAQFFIGLFLHGAQLRALLGEPACARHHAPGELIGEAVALFVKGYSIE